MNVMSWNTDAFDGCIFATIIRIHPLSQHLKNPFCVNVFNEIYVKYLRDRNYVKVP